MEMEEIYLEIDKKKWEILFCLSVLAGAKDRIGGAGGGMEEAVREVVGARSRPRQH